MHLMPPATGEQIAEFEREHLVQMPDKVRQLYLAANGFAAPQDQDQNGFSFWPLSRVVPIERFDDGRWASQETTRCFLFADYLSLSWGYAFELSPGVPTRVCIVGTADGQPRWIAKNFDEFVDLYVSDDERLYPQATDDA